MKNTTLENFKPIESRPWRETRPKLSENKQKLRDFFLIMDLMNRCHVTWEKHEYSFC